MDNILPKLRDVISKEHQSPEHIITIFEDQLISNIYVWINCYNFILAKKYKPGDIKVISKALAICRAKVETLDQQILDSLKNLTVTDDYILLKFVSYYMIFSMEHNQRSLLVFYQKVFEKKYWAEYPDHVWIILLGSLICIHGVDLVPLLSSDLMQRLGSLLRPSISNIWLICTRDMLKILSVNMASDYLVNPVLNLIFDRDDMISDDTIEWICHFLRFFPPNMHEADSKSKWTRLEYILLKYCCYSAKNCDPYTKDLVKKLLFLYSRHVSPRVLTLLAQLSSSEDECDTCLCTELIIHPIRAPLYCSQAPISLAPLSNKTSCDDHTGYSICLEDD